MRQALAAAGVALAMFLAIPQSSRATALEEYATALSGGDVPGMREVVSLHQEEMTRDFFQLLREAASILDRSSYDPEERNKARLLVFVAAQMAQTFDDVGFGRNLLYRHFQDSSLLTPRVQSAVFSDTSLAGFLSQAVDDLGSGLVEEASLARDLRSIFDATVESPEARLRRMQEEREARARQAMEEALAEQRRQRELQDLLSRVERLRRAHDTDGLLGIATDGSLPGAARRRAVAALSETGGPRAAAGLAPLLHDTELQEDVVRALVALGGFLGDGPLEPAVLHKLGELGGTPAIGILVQQLDHPAAAEAAGEALGHIGAPAFSSLLQRSRQPGPGRRAAAAALAAAGYRPRSPEEAARLLLVRGELLGLVRLGPSALPVLTAAARGRDDDIAGVARAALGLELVSALAALALLGLFLRRHWIWPGAELELVPGGRARLSRGLWKRRRRPVETGTVLQTAWARDRLGRRRRIKMEVLASMGPAPEDEPAGTAFDVLVAAGASTSPGTYLAVAPAGSVKIRVKPGC